MRSESPRWNWALGLLLLGCTPLRDLDAASRGSGGVAALDVSTCLDGQVNGSESDVDCGGNVCEKCALGNVCRADSDCAGGSCVERQCQAAHCVDQKMSVGETDVDCGGQQCSPCGVHQLCLVSADCTSNACTGNVCVASGCDNDVVDGSETDLNCGGGTCPACRLGRHCELGGDCESGVCSSGVCSIVSCGSALGCAGAGSGGAGSGGTWGSGGRAGGGWASNGGSAHGGASTGGTSASGGTYASGGTLAQGGMLAASGGAGVSGSAGAAGAGRGGVTGSGGTVAATGGAASGSAGAGGVADPTCAGCARFSVPLASASDKANYVIILPSQKDVSSAIVTLRVYVKAGSGGQLRAYVQHNGSPEYLQLFQDPPISISSLSGWQDIVWNVGAQTAYYDKTIVGRIGVQISAAGATSWTNPTVVYLDSISVSGLDIGPWNFDTSASVSSTATISAAANVMFCNYGDNPVSGSAVAWYSR